MGKRESLVLLLRRIIIKQIPVKSKNTRAKGTNKRHLSAKASFGDLLRERRSYHGWTLSDVSRLTGISTSALSKIENDLMSPTYHTIIQLCSGLEIEISDLLSVGSSEASRKNVTARRSVCVQHSGQVMGDENFTYTYLCGDVAHKRIVPMIVEVRANSLSQIGSLWSHVGEEFIYVLEGCIELRTEFYEPLVLETRDSVYLDSTMGHAFLAVGDAPAKLLILCSSATPNLAQTLRELLTDRLSKTATVNLSESLELSRLRK